MDSKMTDFSKYISYALRHGYDDIGIDMDSRGFVYVDDLMRTGKAKYHSFADLQYIVDGCDVKRFEMIQADKDNRKVWIIRAIPVRSNTVLYS
jgi:RNA:NAD 2'-phosphotransferase (TPT1/KptA family)